jgi:hypothetical protein
MKNKKWIVSIPITGTITFDVKAPDKEAAVEVAWKKYHADGDESDAEVTWEAHECVTEGNVFHGVQNRIEASEL